MNKYIGFLLLFLFFLGCYKLIKDKLKIHASFIPLTTNLFLMVFLYGTGLLGFLKPSVVVLAILSIGYLIITSAPTFKSIFASQVENFKKTFLSFRKNIPHLLLSLLFSTACALFILSRSFNYWGRGQTTRLILLAFLSFLLLYPIATLLRKINRLYQDKLGRICLLAIIILDCLYLFFLPNMQDILPDPIVNIQIRNTGERNPLSQGNAITIIEIKKGDTKEILEAQNASQWNNISIDQQTPALRSSKKDDTLVFQNPKKLKNSYEFLFLKSNSSGIVEININGDRYSFDLYDSQSNQTIFILSSKHTLHDLIVLFLNLLAFIFLSQLLFYYIFSFTKNKTFSLSPQEKIGLSFLTFFLLYIITRRLQFYVWDEFSHWGIFLKELFLKDALPVKDLCTVAPQYLPGITLFEYFFLKFLGYTEGHAYFAHLFFILSEILPFTIHLKKERSFGYVFLFLSMCAFLFFVPVYSFSLYVDAPLGLLFGVGLILILNAEKITHNRFMLFLIYAGLQLIKTWGLVFSGILFLIQVFSILSEKKDTPSQRKQALLQCTLLFSLSIILVQIPWLIHYKKIQENLINSPIFNIDDWENSLNNTQSVDPLKLFTGFLHLFLYGRKAFVLANYFSPLNISLFLLLINLLVSQTRQARKIQLLIFLMYLVNNLLLFSAYLYYFPVSEALKYASFERYISEFLIGWFLWTISRLLAEKTTKKTNTLKKYGASCAFCLFVALFSLSIKKINYPPTALIPYREAAQYYIDGYDNYFSYSVEQPDKIFHIEQDTNGWLHHIMRYELCPNLVQLWGWSIGKPYRKEDIYTIAYPPAELKENLVHNFDFVFITHSDEKLVREYKDVFPNIQDKGFQLFKIENGEIIRINPSTSG